MDWTAITTAGLATAAGLIGLAAGEIRARRMMKAELEAKRWADIFECVRLAEDQTQSAVIRQLAAVRLKRLGINPDGSPVPRFREPGRTSTYVTALIGGLIGLVAGLVNLIITMLQA